MLTRETCKGLWAAVPSAWDKNLRFDADTFFENTVRLCKTGVQAVYATGSSGEFYAYDFDEFKQMVDALSEATKGFEVHTGVGNTGMDTRYAIKTGEYCAQRGIDAIMPAFPFWMPLRDDECLKFLKAMCGISRDLGVIHYNIGRSKRYLTANDYRKLLGELPDNFIGSKSTSPDFYFWCELRKLTPKLVHLPGEPSFVQSMMTGGKGMITSLINLNPKLFIDWYEMCLDKEWERAMMFELKANNYLIDLNELLDGVEYQDPAWDTALAVIGGFLKVENRIREPYFPIPDEIVTKMRKYTEEHYPEFIYK